MDDTFGLPTETELTSDDIPIVEDVEEKDAADKVFDFLGEIGFLELIEDSEEFDTWLKNTPNEKLLRYTTVLNKILTGEHYNDKEIVEVQNAIGSNAFESLEMETILFLPPAVESKTPLLNKSLDVIKTLDSNQDRALLTYYTLQNLHLYKDGNGRTGRLLFALLNSVGKGLKVEEIRDIATHSNEEDEKGKTIFQHSVLPPQGVNYFVNRELLTELVGNESPNVRICATNLPPVTNNPVINTVRFLPFLLSLNKHRELISQEDLRQVIFILKETGSINYVENRSLVLLELINRHPDLKQFKSLEEDMGSTTLCIDAKELVDSNLLTKERLLEIIEIHQELKEKQISKLLDIFQNPQKYTTTNKNGEEVPIKNLFLKK